MMRIIQMLIWWVTLSLIANTTEGQDKLPLGVPRPIDADGRMTSAIRFTTKPYQQEALHLLVLEASKVVSQLKLPEKLPITTNDLAEAFVPPFGYAYANKSIGNIATSNYYYYVSIDNKFCYLAATHEEEDILQYSKRFVLPISQVDTNAAYQQAIQWLSAVSMDVDALNRDLQLFIKVGGKGIPAPAGKFVPIYSVAWCRKTTPIRGVIFSRESDWDTVASVRFFAPTKTLMQLRVEEAKYILRTPLVFTNLEQLLSQTNAVNVTNSPGTH